MNLRRQLPAYSPVAPHAAVSGIAPALRLTEDPRPHLRDLLQRDYESHWAVLCGSGTDALTVAIREASSSLAPGAPVALPAFCCFDIATAAVGANVRASFYDLDPHTLGPDMDSLERTLRAGARVAVIAPLYGVPVDWDLLATIAAPYGALLIEDAAQGHGARWKGRRLGSIGDLAVLSFGRGKGWTGGAGGALLVNADDDSFAGELRGPGVVSEAKSAMTLAAQWALGRPAVYGIPYSLPFLHLGDTVYRAPGPVRSMSRTAAAMVLATAALAEQEAMIRQANAKALVKSIAGISRVRNVRIGRESIPGYLRLPVRLPKGMASFSSTGEALKLGIAPSYPAVLADLPQLAVKRDGARKSFTGARTLVDELVTLPTHSLLTASDIAAIAETVRRAEA